MPSAVEQEVMACGFTEKEVMDVQKRASEPYTDADALLSAVLQSEVEVEEELRRLTGNAQNEELQKALRKLAETDADIEAAQQRVQAVERDGLARFGPEALQTAEGESEEEESESESEEEDGPAETVETEGFKDAASPAASPAESPARPTAQAADSASSPPKQLDRDKVEKAGFDMSEVEKLCAMLGMDAGKTKLVAEDVAAANAEAGSGAPAPEPEPELELPASLVPGDRVEIGGLSGAPQHNGKEGVVVRWVKQKRRYIVEVEGLAKPLAVRPVNLQICLGKSSSDKDGGEQQAEAGDTGYVLQGFTEPEKKKEKEEEEKQDAGAETVEEEEVGGRASAPATKAKAASEAGAAAGRG
jgi:hypothetical protein